MTNFIKSIGTTIIISAACVIGWGIGETVTNEVVKPKLKEKLHKNNN